MEYLFEGRREYLVRAKNHLGETPLHLAVALSASTGRKRREARGVAGIGSKVDAGIAVEVRTGWPRKIVASAVMYDNIVVDSHVCSPPISSPWSQ